MKKLVLATLFLASSILANDTDNNSECLCLKVDKAMAKELKALIKKYNGKVISVSKNTQEQKEFEAKQKLTKSISVGEKLYKSNCQECHGEDATKESYGTSRALTSLTRDQFKDALWGYSNDEYNRGMAMIMRPFADQLIDEDQDKIYEYIQTLK